MEEDGDGDGRWKMVMVKMGYCNWERIKKMIFFQLQILERRLNLSRSQQPGHSTAYNTPFLYLSRMQRIYPLKQCQYESIVINDAWCWQFESSAACQGEIVARYLLSCESYEYASHVWGDEKVSSLSSMDSDLEAFSHNPTHGSFAALSFQTTANTNYANERFLSY